MDAMVVDAAAGDAGVDAAFVCAADFECDDGDYCNGVERCRDTACQPGTPPCDAAAERCDESMDRCTPIDCADADADGDGFDSVACGGSDCNDSDDRIGPGSMEICDAANVDEDCDPATYGFRDADMDGEPDARCCNGETCGTDCDDMRPGVNPTVPEVCGNGRDDDCDGMMDEGLLVDGYADADGDGYGDSASPVMGVCPGAPGFAEVSGDCDESDTAINPGATEACDGVDNNCAGGVDEGLPTMRCYRDEDGDGYGATADSELRCACGVGWATLPGDCADWEPRAHPMAEYVAGFYCRSAPPASCRWSFERTGDFNCDGTSEQRWTSVNSVLGCNVQPPPFTGCIPGDAGWVDRRRACGDAGSFAVCQMSCDKTFEERTQECR